MNNKNVKYSIKYSLYDSSCLLYHIEIPERTTPIEVTIMHSTSCLYNCFSFLNNDML